MTPGAPVVAIQGIRGSFHHEAAGHFFRNAGTQYIPCLNFQELVMAVNRGRADYAVMAVENSLVGGILPNFSLIREASLHINGEVYMRITQNLMALPGERIESLREVHSHPMAIMQAEGFFEAHPHIRLVESADTAISARTIATDRLKGMGAIASLQASGIYGLPVLAASIETNRENFTRFLVLGKAPARLENNQAVKSSLAFVAPHQPGSLVDILQPLAIAGVNLSMLQSLPLVGRSWEYIFHADMVFPDIHTARAMTDGLKARLEQVWVMGIYPPGQGIENNAKQDTEHIETNKKPHQ